MNKDHYRSQDRGPFVMEVIRTDMTRRGAGVVNDPVRRVTQYWNKQGRLLAERDPMRESLADTASDLLALAYAYKEWEADVVMNSDWSRETVQITQAQHDRLIEIQAMRNAAIAKATGEQP